MYTNRIIPMHAIARRVNSKDRTTFEIIDYFESTKTYLIQTKNKMYNTRGTIKRNKIERIHKPKPTKETVQRENINRESISNALRAILNGPQTTTHQINWIQTQTSTKKKMFTFRPNRIETLVLIKVW